MMSNQELPTIIKKVKKGGDHGHHGGAWKVAYADFVTAMMAFFLLMWLLNATSEEQKRGISNYFGPVGMAQGAAGSGGVLGGLSIATEGSFQNAETSPAVSISNTSTAGQKGVEKDEMSDEASTFKKKEENADSIPEKQEKIDPDYLNNEEIEKIIASYDKKTFAQAEEELRKAIEQDAQLQALSDNILIDITEEGLRIQIIDQDNRSMFPLGSAQMHEYTKVLLQNVAQIISKLPNKISVTGHTDAAPYASNQNYGNWELSADRANSSRRILMEYGLPAERINHVIGKADREPLIQSNPLSAQNRRISIVLLRTDHEAGRQLIKEKAFPARQLSFQKE